jgi:PPM family protein phosphatase
MTHSPPNDQAGRFLVADEQGPRDEQQDAAVCLTTPHAGTALLIVSDGVGGQSGGRIASQQIIATAQQLWANRNGEFSDPSKDLEALCREAHAQINAAGAQYGVSPRATIVALYLAPAGAYWIHSGDSRLYHFRAGELVSRTEDHSLLQVMVEQGLVKEDGMGTHPDQDLLIQSLGGDDYKSPSMGSTEITPQDAFLLCTDGFWERTKVEEMAELLFSNRGEAAMLLDQAVKRAVERNGPGGDNVTVAAILPAVETPTTTGSPNPDFQQVEWEWTSVSLLADDPKDKVRAAPRVKPLRRRQTVAREASKHDHVFNDDLLMNVVKVDDVESDVEYAEKHFGCIFDVLDHRQLREKFTKYEDEANDARERVRLLGLCAVTLAAVALLGLVWMPVWPKDAPVLVWAAIVFELGCIFVALIAAGVRLLGLCAMTLAALALLALVLWMPVWPKEVPVAERAPLVFELGFIVAALMAVGGLWLGPWKRCWLESRLMSERLRQWHFQLLVRRGQQIEASRKGPDARQRFKQERELWLGEFLKAYEGKLDAQLELLSDEAGHSGTWLHDPPTAYSDNSPVLADVFKAYEQLRFDHQHNYAAYKLRKFTDKPFWRFSTWPAIPQMTALSAMASACFIFALICSALLVCSHICSVWPFLLPADLLPFRPPDEDAVRKVALSIALIGAALRTIQEGLAPDAEIERYKDYRERISELRLRFKETTDSTKRLHLMEEMEIASVEEMKGFLRTHYNTTFILT